MIGLDSNLVLVDTCSPNFFRKVLEYKTLNHQINGFIDYVRFISHKGVKPFLKPTLDPSIERSSIFFKPNETPAVGYSYHYWQLLLKGIPSIGFQTWKIGTEFEYYCFLVYLINKLVDKHNWSIDDALFAVVINSGELGNYSGHLKLTGTNEICEVFDLGNTCKIISCSTGGFYLGGGSYRNSSCSCPLSNLKYLDMDKSSSKIYDAVAWIILS